jgi:hypothetical protein
MKLWCAQAILGLAILLVAFSATAAEQSGPHIGYVYPAGGQRGTKFRVTVGGRNLQDVTHVYFSGEGIQAAVVEELTKLPGLEAGNALNARLDELLKVKKDAETLKQIATIQRTLRAHRIQKKTQETTPAIGHWIVLEVTLAANAEPGERELRLQTSRGLSNPLVFCVGRLPEFCENEPEVSTDSKIPKQPLLPQADTQLALPSVVNGQIMPRESEIPRYLLEPFSCGDVDRHCFQARKGQQLVITAAARQLIPYLADAVPGWFQATLTLYDAKGKEVAYDDDYRFHPDPVLFYKVPEDGQYTIAIRDAIYRGRADFVYRIAIGELPFITGIFPLGGRASTQTTFELTGWNLPVDKVTIDAKAAGIYPLSVGAGKKIGRAHV